MKVSIELSENQVNGIKDYLKETNGDGKNVTKKDIETYVEGIIETTLQLELSNYINQ